MQATRYSTLADLAVGALVSATIACATDPPNRAAKQDATESGTAASGTIDAVAADTCAPGQGGLTLPAGFCATVFAEGLGAARHMAIRDDGTMFVMVRPGRGGEGGGMIALRDADGDGTAETRTNVPVEGGTGVALDGDWVYYAPNDGVKRVRIPAGTMQPAGEPETLVSGLPDTNSHTAKSIALGGDGRVFVNIGSPGNACQEDGREERSPGLDPCPELDTRAGIWAFDANRTGQTQADGERYATGIRNAVGMAIGPDGALYSTQHGRDRLSAWGFSDQANAEKPAEELFRIEAGDDFGWPYCYYDRQLSRKVLAPEYGGDGEEVGRCGEKEDPIASFPGHWAPNGLVFYGADAFPERYRGGAFIAFHGSWNRAPLPQAGYNVVFVPFAEGTPSADWEVFADGFAGAEKSPRGAEHRPTGVAVGPDGALYVSDDAGGTIWRIVYTGE